MKPHRLAWTTLLLLAALGSGACRHYLTHSIYRRPVILSISVVPPVLAPGDSTTITVTATDPDGDSLVYDWEAYDGLSIRGSSEAFLYNTASPSRVFTRSPSWPYPNDTAFVWCSVRDGKGGGDERRALVFFGN